MASHLSKPLPSALTLVEVNGSNGIVRNLKKDSDGKNSKQGACLRNYLTQFVYFTPPKGDDT